VGVSDDDLFYFQLVLADDGEDVFNVVARIDDHGFVRGLIADDGAITLQRPDGQYLVNHALIFAQPVVGRQSLVVGRSQDDYRLTTNY
jgi:hypothetical protein